MTVAEFLAWENRQELRWEFDGLQPVAMAGGTLEHETIGNNLRASLHRQLGGRPCRVYGPTAKIEVMGRIRYPDAFVTCGTISGKSTVAPDPVIVCEVISPSTSRADRIEKLCEYHATPSILRYVIVEQDSVAATVSERRGEHWAIHTLIEGERLSMPEIGVELDLSDLYFDVELAPLEDDGR